MSDKIEYEILEVIADNIHDRMTDQHDTELVEEAPGVFPQITDVRNDHAGTESSVTLWMSDGRKILITVTFADDEEPDTNGPGWGIK